MNYRRLWLRAVARRLAAEWRRLGSWRGAVRRIRDIRRQEGWSGVRRRLDGLAGPPAAGRGGEGASTARQPGVMLVGHPNAVLGVGENLRAIAAALEAADVPFHIRDVAGAPAGPQAERWGARLDDGTRRYRANLLVVNADEMDGVLGRLGPRFFAGARNIGCWMWELAEFPDRWRDAFDGVHEIWAQSRFVERAVAAKSPVPVVWMPQPVEPGPADAAQARTLGVPGDRFSFLFFFDFRSYVARKNPLAVVEAFERAFPESAGAPVCLVIKLTGAADRPEPFQQFMRRVERAAPRVVVIDRILDPAEMRGLVAGCSAFVSLHRAEGFGRGLAEAMYYGKPVIATGYSGNLDFMTPANSALVKYRLTAVREGEYPFGGGQAWAEPDVEDAAAWMRRVHDDSDLRATLATAARESIRRSHGAEAVGARMADRLRRLGCL